MNDQKNKKKVLRVFGVARHLQITTNDILELLEVNGWDTGRQAMQPVSEEMYQDILNKFDQGLLASHDNDLSRLAETLVVPEITGSDGDGGISAEKEDSTMSGYLPSETTFAARIPRIKSVIEAKSVPAKTKIKSELPAEEDKVYRATRRRREKPGIKILIRSMDLPIEREAVVDFSEEYNLSSLNSLNLNNIDLELITQIVNMSDEEKLDLLEELID